MRNGLERAGFKASFVRNRFLFLKKNSDSIVSAVYTGLENRIETLYKISTVNYIITFNRFQYLFIAVIL